jgi:hypothetical protein
VKDNVQLSDLQRQVLLDMLRREREVEEGKATAAGATWLHGRRYRVSRSESASRSRAIRRLEERGLVERYNYLTRAWGKDVGRTTDLLLTGEGRKLARTLLTHLRWR